jgi:hypothetical protein
VAFGVRSGGEARDIAGRVRMLVPLGSEIEVRPVSRLRRWLVKERLRGNYGGGGGYDGGGGNGGG